MSVIKHFPVAVIEVTDEEEATSTRFARDVRLTASSIVYIDADLPEDQSTREVPYLSSSDQGSHIALELGDDATMRVRPLDTYDGVKRSPAGVPQPLEVLRAEVLRGGGAVAQEMSAVVAEDNTVVTLMLETGVGTYVRFSGDWQRLSDDSTALEDTYSVRAAPSALAVFDAADMANLTLNVFDLPRYEDTDSGVEILINPEEIQDVTSDASEPVVASGTYIPQISDKDTLLAAVRFANNHPASRWYVAKRAKALGMTEHVPMDWYPSSAVVHPFK